MIQFATKRPVQVDPCLIALRKTIADHPEMHPRLLRLDPRISGESVAALTHVTPPLDRGGNVIGFQTREALNELGFVDLGRWETVPSIDQKGEPV
ncbi:hypothetical protein [Acanthopleuribacter pedis]|uniref:Uncharacterized protein n=1 Tax=Acanthopleuribacter pedis TaxID=442870 RepID=A0A8J7U8Q1_9BACT|nr:hypothetical protein [Acanthopleuribacter pedis]MBO1322806.1 hypothetical protein [Acanthopleuribacter pedis]